MEVCVNEINHTAGLRGTATFNCPFTKDCENERCFWKQRDCYGRSPWATALQDSDYVKLEKKIVAEHGIPYFPEWCVFTATNCLMMYCKDTKIDNEYPNCDKERYDESYDSIKDMCKIKGIDFDSYMAQFEHKEFPKDDNYTRY